MRKYKRWVIFFCTFLLSLFTAILLFNVFLDPLWCFPYINKFNEKAVVIDQRQQKTNRLAFGQRNFDTIMLGSSRTEPVAAEDLAGCRAFNYSAPAMYPEEYGDYLRYARKKSVLPIKRVFIGMDFFGTIKQKPVPIKSPVGYFDQTDGRLYRFNSLLSPDTLRLYIKRWKDRSYYYLYDRRRNILIPKNMALYDRKKLLNDRIELLGMVFYSSSRYHYNENSGYLYKSLLSDFNDVTFTVFTSPVTKPLFERMVIEGRFSDYCRWLREIVHVFGGVYNFMYVNSITSNLYNYYDADHFYPEIGTLIAHRITGTADTKLPEDFGEYVTSNNIEQHLAKIRCQADEILARHRR